MNPFFFVGTVIGAHAQSASSHACAIISFAHFVDAVLNPDDFSKLRFRYKIQGNQYRIHALDCVQNNTFTVFPRNSSPAREAVVQWKGYWARCVECPRPDAVDEYDMVECAIDDTVVVHSFCEGKHLMNCLACCDRFKGLNRDCDDDGDEPM